MRFLIGIFVGLAVVVGLIGFGVYLLAPAGPKEGNSASIEGEVATQISDDVVDTQNQASDDVVDVMEDAVVDTPQGEAEAEGETEADAENPEQAEAEPEIEPTATGPKSLPETLNMVFVETPTRRFTAEDVDAMPANAMLALQADSELIGQLDDRSFWIIAPGHGNDSTDAAQYADALAASQGVYLGDPVRIVSEPGFARILLTSLEGQGKSLLTGQDVDWGNVPFDVNTDAIGYRAAQFNVAADDPNAAPLQWQQIHTQVPAGETALIVVQSGDAISTFVDTVNMTLLP